MGLVSSSQGLPVTGHMQQGSCKPPTLSSVDVRVACLPAATAPADTPVVAAWAFGQSPRKSNTMGGVSADLGGSATSRTCTGHAHHDKRAFSNPTPATTSNNISTISPPLKLPTHGIGNFGSACFPDTGVEEQFRNLSWSYSDERLLSSRKSLDWRFVGPKSPSPLNMDDDEDKENRDRFQNDGLQHRHGLVKEAAARLQTISSCCRMSGPLTGRHMVAAPLPAAPTTGACGVPCVGSARWTASSTAHAAANAAAVNALSSWATESEDDSERDDDLHQQLHLRRPDQADLFTRVSTGRYLFRKKQPVQLKILRSTLIVTDADGKDAPIDAFIQATATGSTTCGDGWPPEPPALLLESPHMTPLPVPGDPIPAATQMPWPAQALPALEETHEALVDVFLRVRPLNSSERGEPLGIRVVHNSVSVNDASAPHKQWYDFQGIIDSSSGHKDQEKVFDALGKQVVQSVLAGFDTCIFSLGQTGTGKTYTLLGTPEDPGLLPRLASCLLLPTQSQQEGEGKGCHLSCLELHMDRMRDLLLEEPVEKAPEVRCVPEHGVYVANLTSVLVRDAETAATLIHTASCNRVVSHTCMNPVSSRGHGVYELKLVNGARLCVVDLAGRENEKGTRCRGQNLAELGYINRSLFHLTNVIQSLAKRRVQSPQGRIPFRDSKLTLLLSEYLQSARTFLVATISPATTSVDETLTTLRLAQAVQQITTRQYQSRNPHMNPRRHGKMDHQQGGSGDIEPVSEQPGPTGSNEGADPLANLPSAPVPSAVGVPATGKAPTSRVANRNRSAARSRGHSSASPSPASQTPSSPTTPARRWAMAARSGSASRRAATARVGGA